MTITADAAGSGRGLYRLFAWLSPSFPTGAFSYSHGLEAAAADGTVFDRASLEAWIASIVARGSGRIDADILRDAFRAAQAGDTAALTDANRRGLAYRGTAELALETEAQGEAMRATLAAAWAVPWDEAALRREPLPPRRKGPSRPRPEARGAPASDGVCHAAIAGVAAAKAGVALADALMLYLHALAANLMAAGLRLGLIGQTDGQRILAALEPVIARATAAATARDGEDFGAATFAADLASMAHETLYTRLFRS